MSLRDRFLLRHQGLKAAEVKQEMLTLRCLFLDAAARDAERILSEAGPTGNHVFLRRSDLVLLELACKQTARACWNLQGDDRSNPGRRVTIARLADLVDCARSRQRVHAEQVCVVARMCSYVATRLILDVFCGLPSQLRARDDRQLAVELSVQPQPFIGLQPLCMATRDPPLDAQGSHIGVDVEPPHTFPDLMAANLACLTKAADVLSLLRSCSVRPLAPCLRAPLIHHTCS